MDGRRILVVEDEYVVAEELRRLLEDAGATVVGPAARVAAALRLVADDSNLDAAILDVNIAGQEVFPVADTLAERGIAFVFITGFDRSVIPRRFAGAILLQKPVELATVKAAIGRLVGAPATP